MRLPHHSYEKLLETAQAEGNSDLASNLSATALERTYQSFWALGAVLVASVAETAVQTSAVTVASTLAIGALSCGAYSYERNREHVQYYKDAKKIDRSLRQNRITAV